MKKLVVISLGCCCSVSFMIKKYYSSHYTLFDWNYTPEIETVIQLIENDFPLEIEDKKPRVIGFKDIYQEKLKNYLFYLSHTNLQDLQRRLVRLKDVCRNKDNYIVFIRFQHTKKNDIEHDNGETTKHVLRTDEKVDYNISISQCNRLINALNKFVETEYSIIIDSSEEMMDKHPSIIYKSTTTEHVCSKFDPKYENFISIK